MEPLKLAQAKLQTNPGQAALKLMDCLFDVKEMVNGNPTGKSNSKDPDWQRAIKQLDLERLQYIYGKNFAISY